ncbi:type II toxin-antitoxin system death-on-curing family toxin, partial [Methanoculleus sp. UBA340]|uniref:type II toxin-antitoxin system death-on-curing family toxin n=4 Tax=Methanoculleus TaxID=45989 RepID=UPI00319E6ED1
RGREVHPAKRRVHEKNEVLRKASPSRLRCFGSTSITNGHGFWQGNKRTAYTATDVLILRANGYIFDADAEEVDRFMVTLADLDDDGNSRYSLEEIEDWIRANTKRMDIFSVLA